MQHKFISILLDLLFPWDVTCPFCQRSLVGTERFICCHCEAELLQSVLTPPEQLSAMRHCSRRIFDAAAGKEHEYASK